MVEKSFYQPVHFFKSAPHQKCPLIGASLLYIVDKNINKDRLVMPVTQERRMG